MNIKIFCVISALFVIGLHALTCPDAEEERTDCPRRSEPTCSSPNGTTRLLRCTPECYCKGTSVREEFTQQCYPRNDCPDFSFMLAVLKYLGLEVPSKQKKLAEGVVDTVQSVIPEKVTDTGSKVVSKVTKGVVGGLVSKLLKK